MWRLGTVSGWASLYWEPWVIARSWTGVCRYTPIGRVHTRCGGLTFGVGELPPEAVVCVESGMRRLCAAAETMLTRLGGPCWVGRCRGRGGGGDAAGRRLSGAPGAAGGPPVTDFVDSAGGRPGLDRRCLSIARTRSVATAAAVR
jgi:hypothetical protein